MRRTSIITTLLLVLVIIGLVVALVVTNLPPKQEVTDQNNGQVVGEEKEEEPTYIALDSEIAKQMNDFLHPYWDYYFLYDFSVVEIKFENLTNFAKIYMAYRNGASDKVYEHEFEGYTYLLKKSDLDESMQRIFGKADYIPENFMIDFRNFEYNAEEEIYYNRMGGGGGGEAMPHAIAGIYQVEEYSDRYEVYSKYLYLNSSERFNKVLSDGSTGGFIGAIWEIKNSKSAEIESIAKYKDFSDEEKSGYENVNNIEDIIDGVEARAFVKSNNSSFNYEYDFDTRCKILTKYYDQATEYKHTFMKNEDGTFYWYKSEIIK